jgi:hypothetical protein
MPRTIDPEQQKRNSTGRANTKLIRNAPRIFDFADDVVFVQKYSRLGMWIGVKPARHVELFEQLATKYFRGFEFFSPQQTASLGLLRTTTG